MTRRTRDLMRGSISFRWLPLFLAALLGAGCNDDPTRVAGDVAGTWQLEQDSAGSVYLHIEGDRIEVFTEDTVADCFDRLVYDILKVDGVQHQITTGQDTFTIELRREDEALLVAAFAQEDRYVASTVDPTTLPVCSPPTPSADCAALPVLAVGPPLDGLELTPTDSANADGSRHDLFALRPASPIELAITMRSNEIDSYLLLYDSAGALLDFNDDANNRTLNARLMASLPPACHIVMATSRSADEFGDYELEISAPDADGSVPIR